jgi:hypothetical protein
VPPLGQQANRLVYATCAAGCGQVGNWTFLDISALAPGASAINTESAFMVEASGRVSFFTSGQFNSYSANYVACASNCASLGSWSAGGVLNGNPLHAALDATGTTHVMFRQGDSAAGDGLFFYGRCAGNCTSMASWELSSVGFLHGSADWTSGFAVTPSGRVFMAFNQGEITVDMANNRKLFVNSCAGATCLDLNTWQGFSVGNLDEGINGAWLEPDGESMLLATVDSFDLQLRTCDANCGAAASWSAATTADNSTAMNQSFPPDTGSACPGTSESSNWWPNAPTAAISAVGVVVVHNPYAIVKCPGNPSPSREPTIGRVISSF